MTDHLKRLKEIAGKATNGVFCEYGECVDMYWTNPWSKEKERLCMVMWPAHPAEATQQVEGWFENMGKLWATPPSTVLTLIEAVEKMREALDFYAQAFYEDGQPGTLGISKPGPGCNPPTTKFNRDNALRAIETLTETDALLAKLGDG